MEMTERDEIAAVLADGQWHTERSLFGAVDWPAWFHATIRAMTKEGVITCQHDPFGETWYRSA